MSLSIDDIPAEVLQRVLACLPFHQRFVAVHAVCQQWQNTCQRGIWNSVEADLGDEDDRSTQQFVQWFSEVQELVLHCHRSTALKNGTRCGLVHVLPILPERLHRLVLTVPESLDAREVATHVQQCTALEHLSLNVPHLPAPLDDLAPLSSLSNLRTCSLHIAKPINLPTMFPFLQHCPQLQSLSLAVDNTAICQLPSNLGQQLQQLQVLCLRGVNVASLPESITRCTSLHTLDLSWNSPPLTSAAFPSSLTALKALKRVVLHNTPAHRVPPAFAALVGLEELDVAYNCDGDGAGGGDGGVHSPGVTSGNSSTCQASTTAKPSNTTTTNPITPRDSPRDISRTCLRMPPTWASTLRALCLSSNAIPLHHVAALFPQLPQLERLDLSGCGLAVIPSTMTSLQQLQHLDMSGNALTTLPVHLLLQLPHLSTLACHSNTHMQLPPDTVLMARHPACTMIDLRRQLDNDVHDGGTAITRWDAASMMVLVQLAWHAMTDEHTPRLVCVGCRHGVVVEGPGGSVVYEGVFGGGDMERAVEGFVRRTQPDFAAEVDVARWRLLH